MKLESQVANLELSRRLKGLNIKQESLFYWYNGKLACPTFQEYNIVPNNWYSAFIATELMQYIPDWIAIPDECDEYCPIWMSKNNNKFTCGYPAADIGFSDDNEANARAKMLIYLIENGLCQK